MKALVLGGSGFVGTSLTRVLRDRGLEVTGASRSGAPGPAGVATEVVDLTDTERSIAKIDALAPDVVVHLAAETDVKKAELPVEKASAAAIVETIGRLAAESHRVSRRLVLLSSDYVFDGRNGPYSEKDTPRPRAEYGRVKLAAEQAVAAAPAWLIVRTSMVYGWPGPGHHKNFVSRLVESARAGGRTTAFSDVVRTPIYVGHLTDLMAELIVREVAGLYHAGSANAVSMLDLSLQARDAFGLPPESVEAAEAGDTDPSRPRVCGLEVAKAAGLLRRRLPSTEEGLRFMKEEEPVYA